MTYRLPLGQMTYKGSRWDKVTHRFSDEMFSLIQRNSRDEVLGFFPTENWVINNLK
jgi:hypothetical protein